MLLEFSYNSVEWLVRVFDFNLLQLLHELCVGQYQDSFLFTRNAEAQFHVLQHQTRKNRHKPCQVRRLCLAASQKRASSAYFAINFFFVIHIDHCPYCKTMNDVNLPALQGVIFPAYTLLPFRRKLIGVFTITMWKFAERKKKRGGAKKNSIVIILKCRLHALLIEFPTSSLPQRHPCHLNSKWTFLLTCLIFKNVQGYQLIR